MKRNEYKSLWSRAYEDMLSEAMLRLGYFGTVYHGDNFMSINKDAYRMFSSPEVSDADFRENNLPALKEFVCEECGSAMRVVSVMEAFLGADQVIGKMVCVDDESHMGDKGDPYGDWRTVVVDMSIKAFLSNAHIIAKL